MSKTSIELPESKMQVKYRVMGKYGDRTEMLASFSDYNSAEAYCWAWDGSFYEVWIDKSWVKKSPINDPAKESKV